MNRLATEEQLRTLAQDRSWQVRAVLAKRAGLPDDIYALLARDRSEAVREWLAAFGHAPRLVNELLAQDASPTVADHAQERLRLEQTTVPGLDD